MNFLVPFLLIKGTTKKKTRLEELVLAKKYSDKIKPEELAKRGKEKLKNGIKKLKALKFLGAKNTSDGVKLVKKKTQRTTQYLKEEDLVSGGDIAQEKNLSMPCIKR